MGKLLYNGIMKRWLYGADIDETNKKSAIFKEGYDDPTYMTFKVEFGDWGASIFHRSMIQTGTTVFSPTKSDYDALPIGLLNCPEPGNADDVYWQNSADYSTFNNTKIYSAFQYLRSRNEDTRAKYLYYFVNGLFDIQKNYPFIFKKVSGLGELEKMDPKAGQRLKTPAKITLECFEGLDLKIRTLFEFYRKAAWDDVYQRWILPENMREFKMIIYVFERRIFQDVVKISDDEKRNGVISYSTLNGDIPVKAYECCPCEFNINDSISWGNDYSSGTDNGEESSKLVVEVKNVKTYYKNNLISEELSKMYDYNGEQLENTNGIAQKVDAIMIYDLVENIERSTSQLNSAVSYIDDSAKDGAFQNLTVNTAKSLFLNKNILLENEEASPVFKNYVWGHSLGGAFMDMDDSNINDVMQKTKQQLNSLSEHDTGHNSFQAMVESYANYYMLEDNEAYRGGWIFGLANAPSYDTNKSFWGNLKDNVMNVLTGARQLMLLSGATFIHLIDNCLIDTFFIPPYVYDPIIPYNNRLGRNKVKNYDFKTRTVEKQEFTEISDERKLSEQEFTDLSARELPEHKFSELLYERELPEQDFSELSSREINEQQFSELTSRQIPVQEFSGLKDPRELSNQEYTELSSRDVYDQQYKDLAEPRNIPEQDYNELNPERNKDIDLIDLSLIARTLPGFKDMPLEELRKLPKQDLIDLTNATERSIPMFKADKKIILNEISKIENSNINLLELDKDNKAAEEKAIELLKQNSALSSFKLKEINKNDNEKIKNLKAITLFTKEFTENSDKVKNAYITSVLELKTQLKNVTKEIVNKLPVEDTYILKKGEEDHNNINSALMSQNDIDQINHNMKYLAIEDSDIKQLSFQTLIQLQEELGDAIQQSKAVEGLTAITKDSVATNPDKSIKEKAKNSVIKETKKKKIDVIY